MSSSAPPVAEGFTAPPYLNSGVVAVITVLSVLLTAGLLVGAYVLFTSWRLKNNLRRETSIRFEEVAEAEEVARIEKLREDTVVVHDVGFHDSSLYAVSPGEKPEPSPAPSIFQSNSLLQEIFSSVEERSGPVSGIIDDVIENIVVQSSQLEAPSEEGEGGGRWLARNESYVRAIEAIDDEHNQGLLGEFSVPEEFTRSLPQDWSEDEEDDQFISERGRWVKKVVEGHHCNCYLFQLVKNVQQREEPKPEPSIYLSLQWVRPRHFWKPPPGRFVSVLKSRGGECLRDLSGRKSRAGKN